MVREYSKVAEPHRVLKLDLESPQRGEDIRALQVACERRLNARGIERPLKIDGEFGPLSKTAFDTAAWALGAMMVTVHADDFPVGAQQLIRYPGRRNPEQKDRAKVRMEQLRKERDARVVQETNGGLHLVDKPGVVVQSALDAFRLAYRHESAVHYTMGSLRWQGIAQKLDEDRGQFPRYADCSAMYTWCFWQELGGGPDILNGSYWNAGYTGTLLTHGRPVSLDALRPGDAIIYGSGWPGKHVVMVAEDTSMCFSHGSESGPYYLNFRYRSDIMSARRYVA